MVTKELFLPSSSVTDLSKTAFPSLRYHIGKVEEYGKWEYDHWLKTEGLRYDEFFAAVLHGKTIQEVLKDRQDKGKETTILNLMDYGGAVRNLECDGALSIALSDPRNAVQKEIDIRKNQYVLAGNLMFKDTWRKMGIWLNEHYEEEKKFDLIMCRPLGGFNFMTEDSAAYLKLTEFAWRLLSSDDGMLITQVPHVCEKVAFAWVSYLQRNNIFPADYAKGSGHDTVKLIKTPQAPSSLISLQ